MHPDLYYVLHQQRERELEAALRHRRAAEDRAPVPRVPRAPRQPAGVLTWLTHRARAARPAPGAVVACCPA